MTMTTNDARALAAQYQSSGTIGRTFAAFASGRPVSYERFISECDMTATELGFEAYDDMRALRDYAGDTVDSVWTDTDSGQW
jgi:hypothetical protein